MMTHINLPSNLKDGVRALMILNRKKDGGKSSKDRYSRRKVYIARNPEEFDLFYQKLLDNLQENERIYGSVNSRDENKAIRKFKQNQLDNDYSEDKFNFYVDIQNRFFSSLMKPSSRKTNYFLFDYDSKNNLDKIKEEINKHTEIIFVQETKNGYHIVTKPFNYNLLPKMDSLELKIDGLLLLDWK